MSETPFARLNTDLARSLAGYDAKIAPSIVASLAGLDKVHNMEALRASAKAFESFRPVISPQIAAALAGVNSTVALATYADVLNAAQLPKF